MIKKQKIFIALLVMVFFITFAPHALALAGACMEAELQEAELQEVEVSMGEMGAFTLVITIYQV